MLEKRLKQLFDYRSMSCFSASYGTREKIYAIWRPPPSAPWQKSNCREFKVDDRVIYKTVSRVTVTFI